MFRYFSVASKGSLGVKTQRISISLTSPVKGREKEGSKPESQTELDLETKISIIRIYELLQVYDYFLYPPVISTHRIQRTRNKDERIRGTMDAGEDGR